MDEAERNGDWERLQLSFKAHPWHGIPAGPEAPRVVTAYIEIVPTDTVKYEIDKASGHLKVDRPQMFSNVCPTLYGFIPQTYCGDRVAAFAAAKEERRVVEGDGDPMDICVLSEKAFSHGDFLLQAVPVGGLRLIDRGQADDKIIAVLKGDAAYGHAQEIGDLPEALVDRLKHYFLTYKRPPGATDAVIEIAAVYGRTEAYEVIGNSREDYREKFPAANL
ncbi:MAG TPA: inorganic pyrophosphatase [Thermoanaerobaculia bacterium]|nr:inorganic pyrophosphatase [Thermoanaerobaculia bacterium]